MTARALARSTDPLTSHGAADFVSVDVTEREREVLQALHESVFGLTINEIADRLGRSVVSVSPRLKPLVLKGLVEDSGLTKDGPEGRSRIIWRAR